MNDKEIIEAKIRLDRGEIVVIPTETVYGLAANMFDEKAVRTIFELKNRPQTNPLIVHISELNQLNQLVSHIPKQYEILIDRFWPGPLTLIFPKSSKVSNLITGNQETVAIRMPKHKVLQKLIKQTGYPLVAPSANPYTQLSPTSSTHVRRFFGDKLFVLEGGSCKQGIESTIVGVKNEELIILRRGTITKEMLENIEHKSVTYTNGEGILAPGMAKKHYAPKTPLILVDKIEDLSKYDINGRIGLVFFDDKLDLSFQEAVQIPKKNYTDVTEIATKFYAIFHDLDKLKLDLIIVKSFENKGLGEVLNDKLRRASDTY